MNTVYSVDYYELNNVYTLLLDNSDFDPSLLSAVTLQLNQNTPSTGRCFEVPITTDIIVEPDETFTMSINPNQDVEFGDANGEATVTIVNDDGKKYCNVH